ncbi:anti-sigma factor domain-containing protein [Streptomyces sp. NPDC058371]|uniref:anti-sigma factor n=1 Tax=Streptomyces sp. NPDC058371 TaxID=3346463 RepID=UPI00365A6727
MNSADLHTLAGAYALDALDPDERAAFEAHLDSCAECRQEVDEFAATAVRLALATSVTPPPALKGAVLRRITEVRQEPPRATTPRTRGSGLRYSTRGAGRWALAACLAAAALGGVATWQHQEARQARQEVGRAQAEAERLAAVLTAPDARTHTARLPDGARGTVVVSKSLNRAVFTASGLASLPEGKTYELWFSERGSMRPAGLLDAHRADQAVVMDGPVGGAGGMGITVEPAGGSATPSLPPVGLISFAA